ncbi:hypothetical protein AN958_04532 [Leucoagaricus sp. SymC.cos]|nr:hypothetical protein AN958_04532 [Leucoagaricus sp. SymC.cos]
MPPKESTKAKNKKSPTKKELKAQARRGENWYFEDGSTVIQVEEKLFNIHRTLFERESTFFQTLFSLPQGESLEGSSDDNPIVCQDMIADFRALCWAIYCNPREILAQQNWKTIDFPRMVRLVAISHKYDCITLRDWALDVLDAYSVDNPGKLVYPCKEWGSCGRILDLAYQCARKDLAERIEKDWLGRIEDRSHNESLIAFDQALTAAERSNYLRQFHGRAYYSYLKSTGIFNTRAQDSFGTTSVPGVTSCMDESLAAFNDQRKLRIYQGFWSLSQLRLTLTQAPKLDDNASCSQHSRDCAEGWKNWWKAAFDDNMQAGMSWNDPGDLIKMINDKAQSRERLYYSGCYTFPCDRFLKKQVVSMKANFDNTIPDRFGIPKE